MSEKRLCSYVVTHDNGLAPNPFHGVCSFALCKDGIKHVAKCGDIVVGISEASEGNNIIFIMEVTREKITFEDYAIDPEFQVKKPIFNKGREDCFGDNVYYRDSKTGEWKQGKTFHCRLCPDNKPDDESCCGNKKCCATVMKSKFVLLSDNFVYYGNQPKTIPSEFKQTDSNGNDLGRRNIITGRSHYPKHFDTDFIAQFSKYFDGLSERGYLNNPPAGWSKIDFSRLLDK